LVGEGVNVPVALGGIALCIEAYCA